MNYGPYMGSPYFSMIPTAARGGFFSRLLSGINIGSIVNNTQKTLGIVNQAIPIIKQVQPVFRNAKTMFKVMNEFKRTDTPVSTVTKKDTEPALEKNVATEEIKNDIKMHDNAPTFFL